MPTYDYRCPQCGHDYEAFQKISDRTRAKCPECGTRGKRRITGGAGIHFKGPGFYITDYKRAGGDKPADAPSDGKKSDGSKSSSKTTKKTGAES